MKVNNSDLSPQGSASAANAPQTDRADYTRGTTDGPPATSPSTYDVHLSQLVRNLRSLAADSPERQAKIEQLTRSCASGSYTVDAQATAGAIIGDATKG